MKDCSFLKMDWEIFENFQTIPLPSDYPQIQIILESYSKREYNNCKNDLKNLKKLINPDISDNLILRFYNYTYLNTCLKLDMFNKALKYCKKISKIDQPEEILLSLKLYLAYSNKLNFEDYLIKKENFLTENNSLKFQIEFHLLKLEYRVKYKKVGIKIENIIEFLNLNLRQNNDISTLGLIYYNTNFYACQAEYYKIINDRKNEVIYYNKCLKSLAELKNQNSGLFFSLGKILLKLFRLAKDKSNFEDFFQLLNVYYENTSKYSIYILLADYRKSLFKIYNQPKFYLNTRQINFLIETIITLPYINPHLIVKEFVQIANTIEGNYDLKISLLKNSIFYWKISDKRSTKLMKKIFGFLKFIFDQIGNSKKAKKYEFLKNLKNLNNYFSWKDKKNNFSSKLDKNLTPALIPNYEFFIKQNFSQIDRADYFKNFKKPVKCIIKSYESEESFNNDLLFYQKLSPYGNFIIKLYGIESLHSYSLIFEGDNAPCLSLPKKFFFLLPHRLLILFESLLTLKKNQIFIGKFSPDNIVIDSKNNIKFSFIDEIEPELRIVDGDHLKYLIELRKKVSKNEENYLAPELFLASETVTLNSAIYDIDLYKADVFSLGMILLEVGYKAFNNEVINSKLNMENYEVIKEKIKNMNGCFWIKPILRKMLRFNPEKRYSSLDLIYMFRERYQIYIN